MTFTVEGAAPLVTVTVRQYCSPEDAGGVSEPTMVNWYSSVAVTA
jgi:hypothetical protein